MSGFTVEQKKKRLECNFKELFPLRVGKDNLALIGPKISEAKNLDLVLVISPYDWMRPAFLYLFVKLGRYASHRICSAYDFLDIYLGNDEDLPAISYIDVEVIATYLGYGEFENKRQEDILLQLMSQQLSRNKKLWLFYKGNEQSFSTKYPDMYSQFKEYTIVNLSKSTFSKTVSKNQTGDDLL